MAASSSRIPSMRQLSAISLTETPRQRPGTFIDHPIVWRTYGLAIGIFVFSFTAMLAIGNILKYRSSCPFASGGVRWHRRESP